MNRRIIATLTITLTIILASNAVTPTDTHYSMDECAGSLMPYRTPEHSHTLPDSLTPVFINHVGRHGARYPSSPSAAISIAQALSRADSLGTITPQGRELQKLVWFILETSHNRWGDLDSIGMAEQRGIATRMFLNYPRLFNNGVVTAISSYVPRCVMSMYEFTHQLDRLNNHIQITTSAGRQNSSLMRPFDTDTEYIKWRKSNAWKPAYDKQLAEMLPKAPLSRVLGENYPLDDNWRQLALDEYHIIAGMKAMGHSINEGKYFTAEEYNAAWSCFNLGQYLQRTASTISTIPAEITSDLIVELINTCDSAVEGNNTTTVNLRFGHAETLMPLLSQLHIPGCYYMTNYFDTVAQHWKDFHVVPMASNLQIVISKSSKGNYYMNVFLNEIPVKLIPNDERTILPYKIAREYMNHCLPPHKQLL